MYLGAHLSATGGVWRAVHAASRLNLEALQVFLRPPGRWRGRAPSESDVERCSQAVARAGVRERVFVHGPYLLNPASADEDLRRRSVEVLIEELRWAGFLGLAGVVIHPGSAGSGDRVAAESRCREAIAEAVEQAGPAAAALLLEGTAGAGGQLGRNPRELAALRLPGMAGRVGVCLDFAHLWAAGYDLPADGWNRVTGELGEYWGVGAPDLLHGNDTATELGAGRDRHAPPGAGVLGEVFFRRVLQDPRLASVPMVVEIPPGEDNSEVARVMEILRRWRGTGGDTEHRET